MLDSFVALPLAAKLSMAAVPGKGHVFTGPQWFCKRCRHLMETSGEGWYQPGGVLCCILGLDQTTSW